MDIAIRSEALLGGRFCGDQARWWKTDRGFLLCIADGTGHGEEAEQASRAAVDYVGAHLNRSLQDIFDGCNRALQTTRGASVSIAVIDQNACSLTFAGIGDTSAKIFRSHRMTSLVLPVQPGMLGKASRTVHPFVEPMNRGDVIVMYTDGIERGVDTTTYDDQTFADAGRLATVLLADFGRSVDDRAVLVARFDRQ